MRSEFPNFEFILKPPQRRGHADGLNLLLTLVGRNADHGIASSSSNSNYFLYLEDDWLFLDSHPGAFLDAVALLDASRASRRIARLADNKGAESRYPIAEPLAQVLLNDQASRACAYADPVEECLATPLGAAGWPRVLTRASHSSPELQDGQDLGISYRLHEFGALAHDFSYWPGFTLNPAVWDLDALSESWAHYCGKEQLTPGNLLRFNTTDRRFEQSASLSLLQGGTRVGYLSRMTVRHIGTETSAYVLNNLTRPWDRPPSTEG